MKDGDLVVLKSGGPVMVISEDGPLLASSNTSCYKCLWFDNNGVLNHGYFAGHVLKYAPQVGEMQAVKIS